MAEHYVELDELRSNMRKDKAKQFARKVGGYMQKGAKAVGRGLLATGTEIKYGTEQLYEHRGQFTKAGENLRRIRRSERLFEMGLFPMNKPKVLYKRARVKIKPKKKIQYRYIKRKIKPKPQNKFFTIKI